MPSVAEAPQNLDQLILDSQQQQQELIAGGVLSEGLSGASRREVRINNAVNIGAVALRANELSGKTGFAGLVEAEKIISETEVAEADHSEISRQNDIAHMHIYGSGNRTLFSPEDTEQKGAPIATPDKPVKGILEQMKEEPNSMLGKPMSVRKRAARVRAKEAKAYEDELLSLVSDSGLELSQAKLVMDLRTQDRDAKKSFIEKLKLDGMTKRQAELKATEVYDLKDTKRIDLIKSKSIYSKDTYKALTETAKKTATPNPEDPAIEKEKQYIASRNELIANLAQVELAYRHVMDANDPADEATKNKLEQLRVLEKDIRDKLSSMMDEARPGKKAREDEWDLLAKAKEKMLNKANGLSEDYEPVPEQDELPYEGPDPKPESPAERGGKLSRAKKKVSKYFGAKKGNYGVTFDGLGQATVHTSGMGKTKGGKVSFDASGKSIITSGEFVDSGKATKHHSETIRIQEASADNRRSLVALAVGFEAVDSANSDSKKEAKGTDKKEPVAEAPKTTVETKKAEEAPRAIPERFEDMTPEDAAALIAVMESEEPELVDAIRNGLEREQRIKDQIEKVKASSKSEETEAISILSEGFVSEIQKSTDSQIKSLFRIYQAKKSGN